VNKGRKKTNADTYKNKWCLMAFTTITDMVIKESLLGIETKVAPQHGHTHYQLSYDSELKKGFFYWT
jgi:hypothetical protein